jgi:protein-tyrosine-phosphatase
MSKVYNVLFLCTHNSARSVMAEALMNKLGAGRFKGFSAGSYPKTQPNPLALEQVAKLGFSADQFSSKSWDVFAAPGAPNMDIIITVCDNAAGETCPVWPGHPATAHWGFPDPSDTQGDEEAKRHAFAATMNAIKRRVELLVSLSDEKLAHLAGTDILKQIHRDAATA